MNNDSDKKMLNAGDRSQGRSNWTSLMFLAGLPMENEVDRKSGPEGFI